MTRLQTSDVTIYGWNLDNIISFLKLDNNISFLPYINKL